MIPLPSDYFKKRQGSEKRIGVMENIVTSSYAVSKFGAGCAYFRLIFLRRGFFTFGFVYFSPV